MSELDDLRSVLAQHAPFDSVSAEVRDGLVAKAEITTYAAGSLVLNAFEDPSSAVYVVLDGQVGLWNDARRSPLEPDEILSVGGVFGFSAMLTERSVGPRASAVTQATVARLPGDDAAVAFVTKSGARFLAAHLMPNARADVSAAPRMPAYYQVGDLIAEAPLVVDAGAPLTDVARQLTDSGRSSAVVNLGLTGFGLVTDASLRRRVLVDGLPSTAPVREALDGSALHTTAEASAAETLVHVLETDAEGVIVTGASGRLAGVVRVRDFALSPAAADLAVHQQLRRAATTTELVRHTKAIPTLLGQLLKRGLASRRVISVYSSLIDCVIRRAIELGLAAHPELSPDRFTWLALGSNGRREAVLSSDVDSAVAFADDVGEEEMAAYRDLFTTVDLTLAEAGFTGDAHGVSARHALLSRTDAQWRAAAQAWIADPVEGKGAILTSLLVDSRPIVGSTTRAAAELVVEELRKHPMTMRLLLVDALAHRARVRTLREPWRRPANYDIKELALLPLVNLARWGALVARSEELATPERLLACGGTTFLPAAHAATLAEVFEVLQRLRLRYQLLQVADGSRASDSLVFDQMSPIDRSIVTSAVREISQAQKRMANVASYVESGEWANRA